MTPITAPHLRGQSLETATNRGWRLCPGLLVELALALSIRTGRKWLQGTWGIRRAEFLPTSTALHTMVTQTLPSLVWLRFSYECKHLSKTVPLAFELILCFEKGIFIACNKVESLNSVWSTNKPKHACHSTQGSNTSQSCIMAQNVHRVTKNF